MSRKILFSFGLLTFASSVFANSAAVMTFTTAEGRRCNATAITHNAIVTAAHCLDDFYRGGVVIKGYRSNQVWVHDRVLSEGRFTNDTDLAFVGFPQNIFTQTAPMYLGALSAEDIVMVITDRNGQNQRFFELVKGYQNTSDRGFNVWLTISDNGGYRPGDSGSPVFDKDNRVVGVLVGCKNGTCGSYSLHTGNANAQNVINKIRR